MSGFFAQNVLPSFYVLTVWVCIFCQRKIEANVARKMLVKSTPGVNFINMLTRSFYARRSQKCKKTVKSSEVKSWPTCWCCCTSAYSCFMLCTQVWWNQPQGLTFFVLQSPLQRKTLSAQMGTWKHLITLARPLESKFCCYYGRNTKMDLLLLNEVGPSGHFDSTRPFLYYVTIYEEYIFWKVSPNATKCHEVTEVEWVGFLTVDYHKQQQQNNNNPMLHIDEKVVLTKLS